MDRPRPAAYRRHRAAGRRRPPARLPLACRAGRRAWNWPTKQREWVKRCEALLPYADEDGIVCIPPVRGEASAADRLLNLLAAAYGDAWSQRHAGRSCSNSADHAGKTLETWLREKFFTQHCKLFQHRPFIWHIWDGLRDGFAALVNYHKLDRQDSGDPDLHLPGRLDQPPEAGHRQRRGRRRRNAWPPPRPSRRSWS